MELVQHALSAGHGDAVVAPLRPSAVVAGGGGALGSAIVEQLLASRAFAPLQVLVTQEFHASVDGLVPLPFESFERSDAPAATLAIVVFDRERHANGRDAAFWRPDPAQLPALAQWLRRGGVCDLLVVLPHAAASLPQALKAGLANLDEQAVAALGFERLVFVRSAAPPAASQNRGLQKLADLVLAQLRLMTPESDQPVRARKLAQIAAALAQRLPTAAPGTRVMAPEWVWHAAQSTRIDPIVDAWLRGADIPPPPARKIRL